MAVIANADAMRVAAGHVETVRDGLSTALGNLDREVNDAINRVWGGTASQEFFAVMTRYRESSSKLHQNLSTIAEQIRANGVGYDTTEQDAQSQIHAAGASGNLLNL